MKIISTIFLLVVPVKLLLSQVENRTIETGNNYYRQQQYDKAQSEYDKALQNSLLELKKKNPPKKQEEKKKKEEQKQQPKPKISPREAEQQLKLLEQKEKQVQERLQKNSRTGNSQPKDW